MKLSDMSWHIGLSSWIIQDGNYADFRVGQRSVFALEYYAEELEVIPPALPMIRHIRNSYYQITGSILYAHEGVCVIDFGLAAFREAALDPEMQVGQSVSGGIWLGIDPFFYFEYLYQRPAIPPLLYTWQITHILQETTPRITITDSQGRSVFQRDATRESYTDTVATDAWNDDGLADYLLIAAVQSVPPYYHIP